MRRHLPPSTVTDGSVLYRIANAKGRKTRFEVLCIVREIVSQPLRWNGLHCALTSAVEQLDFVACIRWFDCNCYGNIGANVNGSFWSRRVRRAIPQGHVLMLKTHINPSPILSTGVQPSFAMSAGSAPTARIALRDGQMNIKELDVVIPS
jgi:hypothetical protein